MLNRIELASNAAMKLAKMRFARGAWRRRYRGTMGLATRDSTQRKVGKQTAKMTREAMTKGCDPGNAISLVLRWIGC